MIQNFKRTFFTLFLTVSILTIAQSQIFELGLKSGVNLSYFHGDQYSIIEEDVQLILDPETTVRFTGGIIARLNITSIFSIQTEILYSTKGARFQEDIVVRGQELSFDGGVTLGYIEIPLIMRLSTTRPDRGPLFYDRPGFTFNAYGGGIAAYRTRSTFGGELTGDLFGVPFDEVFKNRVWYQFKDIDYGIVVGTGLEYGADDSIKYLLDIRYTLGLMDIGDDPQTNFSLQNGNISISAGVMF